MFGLSVPPAVVLVVPGLRAVVPGVLVFPPGVPGALVFPPGLLPVDDPPGVLPGLLVVEDPLNTMSTQ